MPRAVVIVAHGSPDPDWGAPVRRLARELEAARVDSVVGVHLLTDGADAFVGVLEALARRGARRVRVVACFLSASGRHVERDLPALVEHARARVPGLELELVPGALGEQPEVIAALARATARLVDAG